MKNDTDKFKIDKYIFTRAEIRELMDHAINTFKSSPKVKQRRGVTFIWKSKRFKCEATSCRYIVSNMKGKGLICRWH